MYVFTKDQLTRVNTWSAGQRFWLQSWLELLHEYSALYFRVRPIPLSAVAAELVDAINLWKRGTISAAAVEDIRLELLYLMREDPLLGERWQHEKASLLGALGDGLNSQTALISWAASQLSRSPFVEEYRNALISELVKAVNAADANFSRIRALSERVIAELLWSGYSDAYLFTRAMRTMREGDAAGNIAASLAELNGEEHEFQCHFRIEGIHPSLPQTFDFVGVRIAPTHGVQPMPGPLPGLAGTLEKQFLREAANVRFAVLTVRALDPYAAADEAGIVVRRALDALVFTAPLQTPTVCKAVYVQRGGWKTWIDLFDTAVFGLLPKGTGRFRRFQDLFAGLVESTGASAPALDAIHIALHWYTAALNSASLDLERTFLSLWIGLEYLVAGHGRAEYSEAGGIIVPIKNFLPKALALYLPAQLLRDLTNYLYRLSADGHLVEQNALVNRIPTDMNRIDEVRLLACICDEDWRTELERQLPHDELLRHRISWLRNEFASARSMLKLAQLYAEQTERDVAHIYRVRNNIAHVGAFGRKLPLLRYGIRIAHDYLSTMIENLLFHTGRDPGLGMSDVLMSAAATFDQFQRVRTKGTEAVDAVVDYRWLFLEVSQGPA